MIDRAVFFSGVRPLFGGRLSQEQVRGMDALLDAWECGQDADLRWFAYQLATAKHETADTMLPIAERGGYDYFMQMYDPTSPIPRRAQMARNMGCKPGDGARYYGRGYVQLTWPANYKRAGEMLGVDLLANPNAAMDPSLAAKIMFAGMREGWFTGRRLADYFTPSGSDWIGARRIINGLDKAQIIGGYGVSFHKALEAASKP